MYAKHHHSVSLNMAQTRAIEESGAHVGASQAQSKSVTRRRMIVAMLCLFDHRKPRPLGVVRVQRLCLLNNTSPKTSIPEMKIGRKNE